MILRDKDLITIEANDEQEIAKLIKRGFVNIHEDIKKIDLPASKRKKKSKSTRSIKGVRSTSSVAARR